MSERIAVNAYVHDGRLCLFGLAMTDHGLIPSACYTTIEGESPPNGPVKLDALQGAAKIAGERAAGALTDRIEREKVKFEAEETYQRANLGDQNAQAELVEIRENAAKGDARAMYVKELLLEYGKKHPAFSPGIDAPAATAPGVPPATAKLLNVLAESGQRDRIDPMGYPTALAACLPRVGVNMPAVVVLANGPLLTRSKVEAVGAQFGSEPEMKAFFAGASGRRLSAERIQGLPPPVRRAFGAGTVIHKARKIQALRSPTVPLTQVDAQIGFELD